jgi:LPXTG-site transpeptidase (sortase) family protein
MKYIVYVAFFLALICVPISARAAAFTQAPSRIIIPSLNLSLPVHTSKIIFNTWEVHLDGASFGEGTTLPGNKGNTVIFSHARVGLFGSLSSVKKGDLVHVFTHNDWFVYKVDDTFTVEPDRIDVLDNHNKYELTLYTCTGDNWTKRFVVKATLLSNPSKLEN